MNASFLLLAPIVLASAGIAQTVVVRDKLVALPPISICQDGATHQTIVTKQRLRPNGFDLSKFVGMPVEVTGTASAITCKFVTVKSIVVITEDQSSAASSVGGTAKVDFYGTANSVYAVYLGGLATSSLFLPGILGPIHIDPNAFVFLGVYAPSGTAKPYLTLSAPANTVPTGVPFYTQAVSVKGPGKDEMTNVDAFQF